MVDERLAACVSLVPGVASIYRWEGEVNEAQECLALLKTPRERYPALEKRLRELHPYETPEIIATEIAAGLPAYLAWAAGVTQPSAQ